MVGTSNLGSWNGHWIIVIHCVYKYRRFPFSWGYFQIIYIYFNRNFHYKPSSYWGSPMETLRWPKWPAAWWTKNWWSRAGSRSRKPPRKPSRHANNWTIRAANMVQYTIWCSIHNTWCKYIYIYIYYIRNIYIYVYIYIYVCIKLYNDI